MTKESFDPYDGSRPSQLDTVAVLFGLLVVLALPALLVGSVYFLFTTQFIGWLLPIKITLGWFWVLVIVFFVVT